MALHKALLDALGPAGWRAAHQLRLLWWRLRRPVNLAVGGLITNPHGEVLLVRHSYLPDWLLPGGGVEWGESAERALHREITEECGLQISHLVLRDVSFRVFKGASNHVLIYSAQGEGQPRADGREIVAAGWFPPNALPEGMNEGSARLIARYGANAPRPAAIVGDKHLSG